MCVCREVVLGGGREGGGGGGTSEGVRGDDEVSHLIYLLYLFTHLYDTIDTVAPEGLTSP